MAESVFLCNRGSQAGPSLSGGPHICTPVGHVWGSQLLWAGRTGLCLQVGSGGAVGPPPVG